MIYFKPTPNKKKIERNRLTGTRQFPSYSLVTKIETSINVVTVYVSFVPVFVRLWGKREYYYVVGHFKNIFF